MARGRRRFEWSQTASLMALVATLLGRRRHTPEEFMPGEVQRQRLIISPAEMRRFFQHEQMPRTVGHVDQ